MNLTIQNLSELKLLAKTMAKKLGGSEIFLLTGDLGAGKTTFVKEICHYLSVREAISSPTFAIVQNYQGKWPIYHFDLYRINHEKELIDLDLDLYFNNNAIIFIEWADKLNKCRPKKFIEINFTFLTEKSRLLTFVPQGSKFQELINALEELKINGFN
ncbi:MAG: tRNA (adenosine(37)-N6)-threonylcarbamoyltransferase complex ATPase subunit type 1 TsaE [Candidatus Margulisiibacteriota bacterium]|jgi:tRNA threonylcarbamoyladenosine biosynthesis protein TsaE